MRKRIILILPGGERAELWGAPANAIVELDDAGELPPSLDEEVASYIRRRTKVLRCSDCYGDGYGVDLEPCDSCLERGWDLWIRE